MKNLKKQIQELKSKLTKLERKHEQYKRESIKWGVGDFMGRAKDTGYTISRAKAQDSLEEMIRRHDCNFGITWDTLDFYIQQNGKKIKGKNRA